MILVLSSSTGYATCALLDSNRICSVIDDINDKKVKGEKLNQLVSNLFRQNNASLDNIDLIAVDIGPGSFSGIRAAASYAIGLSTMNERRVIQFDSFDIMRLNLLYSKSLHLLNKERGDHGGEICYSASDIIDCIFANSSYLIGLLSNTKLYIPHTKSTFYCRTIYCNDSSDFGRNSIPNFLYKDCIALNTEIVNSIMNQGNSIIVSSVEIAPFNEPSDRFEIIPINAYSISRSVLLFLYLTQNPSAAASTVLFSRMPDLDTELITPYYFAKPSIGKPKN